MSRNPEVVKSGYLTKSPPEGAPKMSQWRRRWFVLCDSRLAFPLADRHLRLEYYQSESEARRLADPKGVVDLKNCTQVINREPVKGHRFVFDVHTNDRVFHLAADSAVDKHAWVQTLNRLLFTEPQSQAHTPMESRSVETVDADQKKGPPRPVRPYRSADNVQQLGNQDKPARRPVSFAGGLLNDGIHPGPSRQDLASRPLPGVPGQERKNWPLPPPPGQSTPAGTPTLTIADQQDANYELAVAPDGEDPEPTPYEIAVDINYEHVELNVDEGTHSNKLPGFRPQPQNYEIPVMLPQPSLQTAEPLPPVPPHRRMGFNATTSAAVFQADHHGSMPNISDSNESAPEATSYDDIESGCYGHISLGPRRYSQPDCSVIPHPVVQPRAINMVQSSSSLVSSSGASETHVPGRPRKHYENVGGVPPPSETRQDYSRLHF